jgi:23S rRNA pseudouridine1911/1915/1917 synthase
MPEEQIFHFEITSELEGKRIDSAVAALSKGELTRTRVRRLIDEGNLLLDGGEVKPSCKVAAGQKVELFLPPPQPASLVKQDIPLSIVYEDRDLVIVNKPSGMVVHPAAGNPDGTLVNALLFHCASIEGGDAARPGIVHRLDRDTSGLMVVAKNEKTHARLAAMFGSKSVVREYRALVFGRPPAEGMIDTPYGRSPRDRKKFSGKVRSERRAVTRFRNLRVFERSGISLLSLVLETGRTHQIRVHMSEAGWPVVGDPVYGRRHVPKELKGILEGVGHTLLHSCRIEFTHPTKGSWIELAVEPEPVFMEVVGKIEVREGGMAIKEGGTS